MGSLLLVCFGGALGTGARYLLSTWVAQVYGPDFPRGTILINVTGSFLIGLVFELSVTTGAVPPSVRLFLTTGIIGGYTTYSSFNYETLRFLDEGAWGFGTLNHAITLVVCLVSGSLGAVSARGIARLGFVLGRAWLG